VPTAFLAVFFMPKKPENWTLNDEEEFRIWWIDYAGKKSLPLDPDSFENMVYRSIWQGAVRNGRIKNVVRKTGKMEFRKTENDNEEIYKEGA
jgi:hypothetical protein